MGAMDFRLILGKLCRWRDFGSESIDPFLCSRDIGLIPIGSLKGLQMFIDWLCRKVKLTGRQVNSEVRGSKAMEYQRLRLEEWGRALPIKGFISLHQSSPNNYPINVYLSCKCA